MTTPETFTKFGKFVIASGKELWGELHVAGKNSLLYLRDDESFDPHVSSDGCITGVLHDPGTSSRIDYSKNGDVLVFLTNTLEFVFGASELVEAGWDIQRFAGRGSTMTHPYGSYLVTYKSNLEALKALINH